MYVILIYLFQPKLTIIMDKRKTLKLKPPPIFLRPLVFCRFFLILFYEIFFSKYFEKYKEKKK